MWLCEIFELSSIQTGLGILQIQAILIMLAEN